MSCLTTIAENEEKKRQAEEKAKADPVLISSKPAQVEAKDSRPRAAVGFQTKLRVSFGYQHEQEKRVRAVIRSTPELAGVKMTFQGPTSNPVQGSTFFDVKAEVVKVHEKCAFVAPAPDCDPRHRKVSFAVCLC